MKPAALLLAWSFLYYDPALTKRGLTERTLETHAACEELRIEKYNHYVKRYGWTGFLNHKGWWVSPACEHRKED